jgi:hypothetical protein
MGKVPIYERIGCGYAEQRRPDPRLSARVDLGYRLIVPDD